MNLKLRKKARSCAYQLIFASLFSENKVNKLLLEKIIQESKLNEESDYINAVYYGVISKYDEIVSIISNYAIGFKIDRIYKTDFAALLLAIYEMKYVDSIPLNVSISEAVELVKIFSTEKSSSYVNGILSSVYKDLNDSK